jgi:hypothetical protein
MSFRVADSVAIDTGVVDAGLLRSSVGIAFDAKHVSIDFGPWQTRIPRDWVDERPLAVDMLSRRATVADGLRDSSVASLAELLDAQGCFVPDAVSGTLTLSDVRSLFEPMKLEWYATYYSHPLWNDLREGRATRNEFVAWVIHNYHVSRAAGVVAARMGTAQRLWQQFFRQDALEEFWHCDAYYFVDAPELRVDAASVRSYVPLPSTLAFEQVCTRAADDDPLAHLLIAYFQESSIVFRTQSEAFYDEVEARYEAPGFFKPWRDHIKIDVDHKHAEGLRNLFEDSFTTTRDELAAALRRAWTAFYFLLSSLDDVQAQASENITLRVPQRAPTSVHRRATSVAEIVTSAVQLEAPVESGVVHAVSLAPFLLESSLRALAHGRSHDEIMFAGNVARALERTCSSNTSDVREPWVLAIGAFLAEVAVRCRDWHMCIEFLVRRTCALYVPAFTAELIRVLSKYTHLLDVAVGPRDADTCSTTLLQLDELLQFAVTRKAVIPSAVDGWVSKP